MKSFALIVTRLTVLTVTLNRATIKEASGTKHICKQQKSETKMKTTKQQTTTHTLDKLEMCRELKIQVPKGARIFINASSTFDEDVKIEIIQEEEKQ